MANRLQSRLSGWLVRRAAMDHEFKKRATFKRARLGIGIALAAFVGGATSWAQEGSQEQPARQSQERPIISEDKISAPDKAGTPEEQSARVADGKRHGLPLETYGVAPGTRILVALDDELGTKETRDRTKFTVKTLEPLPAGSGIYLPSGAEIRGHVSHAEPAGMTGRAKLWLTFDEIQTKFGRLPIVAEVVGVPGDHTVRCGPKREGLIEGRTSTQEDAANAALAGAALGALQGVKDKDKKEAAEGAAVGAITAYLAETGRGHELQLPKGTKLELELERALYLVKE